VDNEIDYTKHTEPELVEMFSRMDPRYAPANSARLKELLIERGYIVNDGGIGPGSAVPSPEKLQALIGSAHPIECRVGFDQTTGLFRWLERAHNDFGLVGSGTLQADGIHVWLSGRRAGLLRLFGSLFQRQVELAFRDIIDVESDECAVHFAYRATDFPNRVITLWFSDPSAAERLAAILPKERSAEFRPQLKARVEFERYLIAQSPQTPVTVGLVGINTLVFVATVLAGAEWFVPRGTVQIAWGSNFGPFTTDGEWWRVFTSLFIHFGAIHLAFNMWALAAFGPLVERLYGSVNYLLIYLVAGIAGSLASISWRPDINSAGASGAIFGILGALLAAQVRTGKTFPSSVVRPLRNSTLVFVCYALLNGFATKGVDDAAHLGGLAAGFLIGLTMARPITGERSYTRSDLRYVFRMLPVAALFLAGGLWCAQRASASLTGEGLYWHTIHWLIVGERAANSGYNAALTAARADKGNHLALAEVLKSNVLPFWREASARTSAIHLAPDSPNLSKLQLLHHVSEGRIYAYALFAQGLQSNNSEDMARASLELARIDDLLKGQQRTR
jgi:rhomboid protease GluP